MKSGRPGGGRAYGKKEEEYKSAHVYFQYGVLSEQRDRLQR
jgi:hypothetical protein